MDINVHSEREIQDRLAEEFFKTEHNHLTIKEFKEKIFEEGSVYPCNGEIVVGRMTEKASDGENNLCAGIATRRGIQLYVSSEVDPHFIYWGNIKSYTIIGHIDDYEYTLD